MNLNNGGALPQRASRAGRPHTPSDSGPADDASMARRAELRASAALVANSRPCGDRATTLGKGYLASRGFTHRADDAMAVALSPRRALRYSGIGVISLVILLPLGSALPSPGGEAPVRLRSDTDSDGCPIYALEIENGDEDVAIPFGPVPSDRENVRSCIAWLANLYWWECTRGSI